MSTNYRATWPITSDQASFRDLVNLAGAELPDLVDADHCVMMASPSWQVIDRDDSPTGLALEATVKVRELPAQFRREFGADESKRVGLENREIVLAARRSYPGDSQKELAIRTGLCEMTVHRHLIAAARVGVAA